MRSKSVTNSCEFLWRIRPNNSHVWKIRSVNIKVQQSLPYKAWSDKRVWTNSVNPDHTTLSKQSDQGLHSLHLLDGCRTMNLRKDFFHSPQNSYFQCILFSFFFYQIKVFHIEFNLLNNMGEKIICEVLQCFLKGVKKVRSAIHHRIWKQAKQNLADYFAFSIRMWYPVVNTPLYFITFVYHFVDSQSYIF